MYPLSLLLCIRDRATPRFEGPSPLDVARENPYTPELDLVGLAFEKSPSLNQLAVRVSPSRK